MLPLGTQELPDNGASQPFRLKLGPAVPRGQSLVIVLSPSKRGEAQRWLESKMEVSSPVSTSWRDPAELLQRVQGLPRKTPPGARLPAGSKAFQRCEPGLRPELLTGGPERDRENARVSVTAGRTRRAALETESKNSSAEGFPSGLRSLYFPGPLSPI